MSKKKKLGRNEPCHCGSGKKFKKCCWNEVKSLAEDYVKEYQHLKDAPNSEMIENTKGYTKQILDAYNLEPTELRYQYVPMHSKFAMNKRIRGKYFSEETEKPIYEAVFEPLAQIASAMTKKKVSKRDPMHRLPYTHIS